MARPAASAAPHGSGARRMLTSERIVRAGFRDVFRFQAGRDMRPCPYLTGVRDLLVDSGIESSARMSFCIPQRLGCSAG